MIDLHEAGILVRLRQKHFRFLKEDICVPERSWQPWTSRKYACVRCGNDRTDCVSGGTISRDVTCGA